MRLTNEEGIKLIKEVRTYRNSGMDLRDILVLMKRDGFVGTDEILEFYDNNPQLMKMMQDQMRSSI